MKDLKNILTGCFLLCVIASKSVFAAKTDDFVEYYNVLRDSKPATESQHWIGKWIDSDTGSCPGITFPKIIDKPGSSPDPTIPSTQNEIKIDPKSVEFPYNCYTRYTANVYKNSQPTGETTSCTVGIRLIMQGNVVESANLFIQSGFRCNVSPTRTPAIILQNIYSD